MNHYYKEGRYKPFVQLVFILWSGNIATKFLLKIQDLLQIVNIIVSNSNLLKLFHIPFRRLMRLKPPH